MESLPNEMVEIISKDLTPEDLARCCGVSRRWREVFNQDWLWKPQCDPELEEHLRTMPCMAEPVFVSPQGEDSTLAAIGQWRLAFLREKHLHNNWKHNNFKEDRSILDFGYRDEFLTESHIVRWFDHDVEIWDATLVPAKFVTKADISDKITSAKGQVVDGGTLLVEKENRCTVLEVDLINKCINCKRDFYVEPSTDLVFGNSFHQISVTNKRVLKERMILYINSAGSKLIVHDLHTGNIVKEEPCPVLEGKGKIITLKSSRSSDDILVVVRDTEKYKWYDYVYSPKQLRFLFGSLSISKHGMPEIYGNYLIDRSPEKLKICNYHTPEVIIEICEFLCSYDTFNECFIFTEKQKLKIFSPSDKSTTILFASDRIGSIEVIGGRFVQLEGWETYDTEVLATWEIRSGKLSRMAEPIDFCFSNFHKAFNRWLTKVLDYGIRHYW